MSYHSINIPCSDEQSETLASIILDLDYLGSSYEDGILTIYSDKNPDIEQLNTILANLGLELGEQSELEDRNWNKWWESNFHESLIGRDIQVRAPFHKSAARKHEIVIQPAMAFGTGHHGTTSLMLEAMLEQDFKQKEVLDMGCGSGILSIMAEKLGAAHVLAIDYDIHSVENSNHNLQLNHCLNVEVLQADSLSGVTTEFDIILSNIVKGINLGLLPEFLDKLKPGGLLLLCGFLIKDEEEVLEQLKASNLKLISQRSDGEWLQLSTLRSK